MPKHRRERIVCPCTSFQGWSFEDLYAVSRHTRFMSVQQTCKRFTAHPLLFHSFASPLYMQYITPLTDYIKDLLPISTVVGIFPAKLAASETIVKFCLWSCDCEQSSFSSEKRILHTQFVFMSFLAACGSRKYPSTGWKVSKGGKKETVKRTQREFVHYAERKFLQRS